MVYPNNGWHRIGSRCFVAVGMALFALGCASSATPPIEDGVGRVQTLGEVSVERDGADSVILLEGLMDPVYTVTDREDDLMVIDLVGVVVSGGGVSDGSSNDGDRQLAAYDGVVDLVDDGDRPGLLGVPRCSRRRIGWRFGSLRSRRSRSLEGWTHRTGSARARRCRRMEDPKRRFRGRRSPRSCSPRRRPPV